jgi:hypothetical protein
MTSWLNVACRERSVDWPNSSSRVDSMYNTRKGVALYFSVNSAPLAHRVRIFSRAEHATVPFAVTFYLQLFYYGAACHYHLNTLSLVQ